MWQPWLTQSWDGVTRNRDKRAIFLLFSLFGNNVDVYKRQGGERVFRSGSGNKEEEQREDEGDDGQENMRTVNHAVRCV